jgi:hypothetical protein
MTGTVVLWTLAIVAWLALATWIAVTIVRWMDAPARQPVTFDKHDTDDDRGDLF